MGSTLAFLNIPREHLVSVRHRNPGVSRPVEDDELACQGPPAYGLSFGGMGQLRRKACIGKTVPTVTQKCSTHRVPQRKLPLGILWLEEGVGFKT